MDFVAVTYRWCVGSWLLAALVMATGCDQAPPSVEVKGTVVYAGKPVFPGSVIIVDDQERSYVGNLDDQGRFRVLVESQGSVKLAIKTIKLGNAGRMPASGDPDAEEGSREAGVPDKFRNANVNIPTKYSSVDSSGLSFELASSQGDLGTIKL